MEMQPPAKTVLSRNGVNGGGGGVGIRIRSRISLVRVLGAERFYVYKFSI